MTQNLSRGDFGCIIPYVRFADAESQQLYIVVRDAPFFFRHVFYMHYISRWSRKKKMAALKISDKNQFYGLRDQLQSYVLGALNSLDKKSVRTMRASEMG